MNRRFLLKATAAMGVLGVAGCATGVGSDGTIVDVAAANETFSTLVAAVTAADLAGTLSGPGPFTVFAPTDDAFAALPAGTVDNLLLPENQAQLVDILTYHVVPGIYPASSLNAVRGALNTVQGKQLRVNGVGGVKVNGANVIIPDVAASNGLIHAIDTVLLP